MSSFSLPNLDDKICYENVQEKIALNLFECVHWPDNLVEEFCDEIDRFPIEFVTEILNQFRCYYDYTRTDYRVLSRYEDQDKITKITMIHYLVLFEQEFVLRRLISRYQIDFEIKINMFIDDAIVCELTALWISTFKNLLNITELLLSYGANANTSNNKGSTPLRLATLNKNVSMMKLLLSYKADPNQSNIYGNSCLMLAAKESNNLEIIELLLDNGADPNHAALCGNTSLHMAALGTNLEAMQLLLKYGAKLTKNHANQTPIHIYAFRKNIDDLDSLDLVISDEDRIVMEEFHASGYLFAKDHRTICSEKIFQHLERAFRLRKQSENSQLLHPKSIEQRPEYEEIIPIRTLEEFQMLKNDPKRLAYECLFAWIRFNGPDSLKTAEGLLMLGARLIDQFGLYVSGLKMWIRAIQIKIKLKVFISHDLFRYFEAIEISLRHNNCDYDEMASFLLEGLEFANDYFHQRPLLNDLEEAINDPKFRLKNRQKFTLNDVKIELQLPPLADFAEKQHSDIDQTIESILILIKFLAKVNFLSNRIQSIFLYISKEFREI
ncbi:Fem-1-like protein [Sarcoptes scabiei]|uniref:Alpha-latrotoxin n=1 Tax=Sarcoptes scabiei TaxID=52283 RepID=A0A132A8V9_SARSC|nr:Fem-1-like protein [Sarcoptes scabiei]